MRRFYNVLRFLAQHVQEGRVYKLEHRIIFIVKSDSTWFEANRRYVKMFGEIFAAAASGRPGSAER